MKYHEYVFEGNPGAGKTTVMQRLSSALEEKNLKFEVKAPFRIVKEHLRETRGGEDPLYDIWQSKNLVDAEMALGLLRQTILQSRNEITSLQEEGTAILLYDRGWLTLLRALEDLGRTSDIIDGERDFWLNHGQVPDTFFITTPSRVSIQANTTRGLQADWRFSEETLRNDHARRATLIDDFHHRVIERFEVQSIDQDRGPIIAAIQAHILNRLDTI